METVLQLTEDFPNEQDAAQALVCLTEQLGFLGGKLRRPSPCRPKWGVQAFFEDEPEVDTQWLPDGMRRVLKAYLPRVLDQESS